MSLIKRKESELFPTFTSMWDDFFNRDFYNRSIDLGTSIPAVNTAESETSYTLELAIPGFKKEDFNIDVENNILTVSSEKQEEKSEKEGEKITRTEFNYTSFKRSFKLPENVKEEEIHAEYTDGLLKLKLPKVESSNVENKRKIAIQ